MNIMLLLIGNPNIILNLKDLKLTEVIMENKSIPTVEDTEEDFETIMEEKKRRELST